MRRGLLGKGALLTVTSQPARTSPVTRGKWFLQTFLGVSPPDPPPERAGASRRSRRTRPATRRSRRCGRRWKRIARIRPARTCHQIFEPIGLALENFDAVGAWRTHDEGSPIDATGVLVDGTKIDGVAEPARRRWCATPISSCASSTEKLLTYALGRGVEYQDMPLVRSIVRDAAAEQLPVLVARAGHRQERAVPDEHESGSRHDAARAVATACSCKQAEGRTTCSLPRSTSPGGPSCAAPARRWRCRCSTRWCRRRRRWRRRRPAPKPRFVGLFVPHGMAPGYWVPEQGRRADVELPFNFKPLEPFREPDGRS